MIFRNWANSRPSRRMAMQKKYIVRLTKQERSILRDVIRGLKGSSMKVRRAQVLLKCDADGPSWTDQLIAEAFGCRTKTVENIRQRLVTEGFEETLHARQPIEATKDHPRRVDYEYERAGTASVFMFAEPLSGWREVRAREQRTKVDWAWEMASLLRTRLRKAEKVILVCDNLNTHTMGAFYEAFAPAEARELVRRLDFRYTPKHGSWLNVAENELSSLYRQCLRDRRFGTIEELRDETKAWAQNSNERQRGVDWQFKIDDARTKLKSLYSKIQN